MSKRTYTTVEVGNPKDLDLLTSIALQLQDELTLAPDEVTSIALSEKTGQPVSKCYKYLRRKEVLGELFEYRRIKQMVVFKAAK